MSIQDEIRRYFLSFIAGTFLRVGLLAFVAVSIIVFSSYVPLRLAAFIISLFFGFFRLILITRLAMLRRRMIMPQLTVQALREMPDG